MKRREYIFCFSECSFWVHSWKQQPVQELVNWNEWTIKQHSLTYTTRVEFVKNNQQQFYCSVWLEWCNSEACLETIKICSLLLHLSGKRQISIQQVKYSWVLSLALRSAALCCFCFLCATNCQIIIVRLSCRKESMFPHIKWFCHSKQQRSEATLAEEGYNWPSWKCSVPAQNSTVILQSTLLPISCMRILFLKLGHYLFPFLRKRRERNEKEKTCS